MCLFPNKSQSDGDMPMARPSKQRAAKKTREEMSCASGKVKKKADDRKRSDEIQKNPTQRSFRLLALPPELWIKIGKLVIDDTPPCTNSWWLDYLNAKYYSPYEFLNPSRPAITYVCSILRAELLPHYYRTKVDIAAMNTSPITKLTGRWLRSVDPTNRRLIGGVSYIMSALGGGPEVELARCELVGSLEWALLEKWRLNVKMESLEQVKLGPKYKVVLL